MFNILKKKNDTNDNLTENLNDLDTNNSLLIERFNDLNVNIYGTYDEPLFKATDIGDLLGIKNIRKTIDDFDEGCKIKINVTNSYVGNNSNTWFLTEDGLYELLFISRKPIAKQFKVWVRNIIKEIRLKGKYDLEERLKQKEIEYQKQLEQKEIELNSYKEKKYEEIEKNGHVYIIKTDGGYKVGKTKDINNRMKGLQTANLKDIEVVLDFRTSNSDLLERTVHYVLDRYRCNSNREFFDCNINHIKNVINIIGSTIDTLKSCYQNISNDELTNKLNEKMCTNYNIEGLELINPPLYTYDTDFENWLNENIEINKNGILRLKDVCQKYLSEDIIQISTKQASLYKIQIEKYLEKKYPFKNSLFYKYKDSSFHGIRYKGWLGFQLK